MGGKITWAERHLPLDCNQRIIFDIRGQEVQDSDLDSLVSIIGKLVSKDSVKYSIEFKTA